MRTCLLVLGFCCWICYSFGQPDGFSTIQQQIEVLQNGGKTAEAIQRLESYLERKPSPSETAWGLNKLGDLHLYQSDTAQANSYFEAAYQIAQQWQLDTLQIQILQHHALYFSSIGQEEKGMVRLKTALRLAQKTDYTNTILALFSQIYTNHYANGELDSALYYFSQLLELKQLHQPEHLMTDWSAIAKLYIEKGDYAQAQTALFQGRRAAEEQKDSIFLTTIFTDLAKVAFSQEDYQQAYNYAQQAIDLAQILKINYWIAQNLQLQGKVLFAQQQHSEALRKFNGAIAIHQKMNNSINLADIYLDISHIYQEEQDLDQALFHTKAALEVQQRNNNAIGVLNAQLLLAELQLQKGQTELAIQYLLSSLEQSHAMQNDRKRRQTYWLLSEAYADLNQYKVSADYFRKYHFLNDTLFSIEQSRVINEIATAYETEKNKRALLEQSIQIETQQSRIQQRNVQLLYLSGGLILMLLTTILLYINYQRKKQLNRQKIAVLNKEKETQVLRALIEGEEKERKRIARDLHDDLGALLAAVKFRIDAISRDLPSAANLKSYSKAGELIDVACGTLREISHNMMPRILEQENLEQVMEESCMSFMQSTGLQIDFIAYVSVESITQKVKLHVYRIFLELLRNAIQHAYANTILVQLTAEHNMLQLVVEDNGVGFEQDNSEQGIGLENIQSRVKYLNGSWSVKSKRQEGTSFSIDIPLSGVQ